LLSSANKPSVESTLYEITSPALPGLLVKRSRAADVFRGHQPCL